MRKRFLAACAVMALAAPVWAAGKAAIKDAESASHADQAASCRLVHEYTFEDCRLAQFNLSVLSHYSYILSSGKDALLIDPGRDIGAYMEYLKKNDLALKGVFLTHSHADFVAGHIEAARAFGVPVHISRAAHAGYEHKPIKDGDTLQLGKVTLRFLETPGHTLDGVCALVSCGGKEQLLLTGDTLFVGSIGRPDLMGGTISAAELAGKSFDSWTNKLAGLSDDLRFFPAHGAGSLCGAHLKDEPFSTIGREKRENVYLQAKSRNAFIAGILDGLPEAPQYFKYNAAMNRKGPEPVRWDAPVDMQLDWNALTDPKRYYAVDLRDAKRYAAGHVPNSVNIALRGRFENWVGIMVRPDEQLVLIGDRPEELREGMSRLHRIGYAAKGVLYQDALRNKIAPRQSALVAPAALYGELRKGAGPMIVDVRLPNEWAGVRIGEIVNLPLNHLAELSTKLNPSEAVVTVCNSAYRSSMAVGILERNGFKHAGSVDGGTEAWMDAGLPVFRGSDAKHAAAQTPETPGRRLPIPDRIGAQDLYLLMRDLPGSFELVDLRSPADFAEFTLPGAKNADIAEVVNGLSWRSSKVPLILIDRDGSVAMAVGAILCKESERPVKVLYGGLDGYWKTFGSGNGAPQQEKAEAAPAKPAPVPQSAPPLPAKKQSPGC